MKKIKILQVLRDAEGGMKKHVETLAKGLDKNKFEVILVCALNQFNHGEIKDSEIKIYSISLGDRQNPLVIIKSLRDLINIIKKEKVDLIHAHGLSCLVSVTIAAFFCGNQNIISTIHNFPNLEGGKRVKLVNLLAGQLLKYNRKIVVVSRALGDVVSTIWRIPLGKLKIIYNGVNIKEIQEALQVVEKDINLFMDYSYKILNASRLIPEKGVDIFIEAASYLKKKKLLKRDIQFLIAGDGPERKNLEEQVQRLDLEDTVFFLGHRNDIYHIMDKSDMIVLSSRREGLGLILLEALSLRKPIVASKVGGIPEIIRDRQTGYLVEMGDVRGFAETIALGLNDAQTTARMIEEGYEMVRMNLTLEKMVEELEKLYIKLIG